MRGHQIAKEFSQRGKLSADGAFFPIFGKSRQVRADDVNVDAGRMDLPVGIHAKLSLSQKFVELRQIAQIVPQRVRREVPLVAQMVGILLDHPVHEPVSNDHTIPRRAKELNEESSAFSPPMCMLWLDGEAPDHEGGKNRLS